MKKGLLVIPSVILFCLVSGCEQQGTEPVENSVVDIQAEKAEVQAILTQYGTALAAQDINLLSEIFSQDEDIVMLDGNTSRRLIGWHEIKERYQEHFAVLEKLDVTYRDLIIKIHDTGEAAWLACVFDWTLLNRGKKFLRKD